MQSRQHIGNVYEENLEEIRKKLIKEEKERISSCKCNDIYHDIMLAFPVLKEYGLI